MTRVVACIDGSRAASAVCDYAAWASHRLQAPVTLFHVLDQERYPAETDLAGTIGLGSREHLMEELAELDQKRSKLALEQGHHMLNAAEERVSSHGVADVIKRQRHGDLTDSLLAIEHETRLLVMGLHGETSTERDAGVRWLRHRLQGRGTAGQQPGVPGFPAAPGDDWSGHQRPLGAA